MEEIRWTPDEPEDPVLRVKAARKMSPRQVTRLREALAWRDDVAKAQDRAPFRVASDSILVDVAESPPTSARELGSRKGINGRIARDHGQDLVDRLRAVDELGKDQLRGYPPPRRRGWTGVCCSRTACCWRSPGPSPDPRTSFSGSTGSAVGRWRSWETACSRT